MQCFAIVSQLVKPMKRRIPGKPSNRSLQVRCTDDELRLWRTLGKRPLSVEVREWLNTWTMQRCRCAAGFPLCPHCSNRPGKQPTIPIIAQEQPVAAPSDLELAPLVDVIPF